MSARAHGTAAPLRQAVAFLTPFGGARTVSPDAVVWFPVVGVALGGALGLAWELAARAWPPAVAAGVVVVLDLALTGMIHIDGLADSADGLLPHLPRERRLAVMREPSVGAFGVTVVVAALLLRWAALLSLSPAPLLLAGVWCASRSLMVLVAARVPYARPEGGLASGFLGGRPEPVAACGLLTALVLAGLWHRVAGAVAVLAALVAGLVVAGVARRRVGGFTGDVLGATGVVAETVALLIAAARW